MCKVYRPEPEISNREWFADDCDEFTPTPDDWQDLDEARLLSELAGARRETQARAAEMLDRMFRQVEDDES